DPFRCINCVLPGKPGLTSATLFNELSSISARLPSRDQSIAGPQFWQRSSGAPPVAGIMNRSYLPAISSANDSLEPSGLIRGQSRPFRSSETGASDRVFKFISQAFCAPRRLDWNSSLAPSAERDG